jgi:hypothetical protein
VREDARRPAATGVGPVRVPQWAYPLVTIASLLIGAEAVVRGTRAVVTAADSDLTNFFLPSADYILRGDPWHMYAVRASGLYPNFNPPLSMFLYAPLLALARAVGFAHNLGEQITFISLPFLLVTPLLGLLVLYALRRLYPQMPDAQRLLAYVLVVLSPLTWQSFGTWYHLEQPVMLCLLVGSVILLQARREGLAGLLAGLALLTRTTALFPLLALGVLLLLERRWRPALLFGGVAAAVSALGLAPFFLADRANAVYSFLAWRGTAAIGGNSLWSIFASGSPTGIRHTLNAVAERLDMPSVLLFVLASAFLAARRLKVSAYGRDAWAVMTIAALSVPMLSKTNWPYYYLEPFILLLVWEFATMHDRLAGLWRWPVLTFGFLVVAATLSEYLGLKSVGALDRVLLGLVEFGAMLAFAAAIWVRMRAAKPGAESRPAGAARAGMARPQVAWSPPANLPPPQMVPGAQVPPPGPVWPSAAAQPWMRGGEQFPASPGPAAGQRAPAPGMAPAPGLGLGPTAGGRGWGPGQSQGWGEAPAPAPAVPPPPFGQSPSAPSTAAYGRTPSAGSAEGQAGRGAAPRSVAPNEQGGADEWPDLGTGWPPMPPANGREGR